VGRRDGRGNDRIDCPRRDESDRPRRIGFDRPRRTESTRLDRPIGADAPDSTLKGVAAVLPGMTRQNARCADCGSWFPRSRADTSGTAALECPICGSGLVQGNPTDGVRIDRNNARCESCGAEFPRRESITDTKGVLECPACGSTGDVVLIEE